jgi:hypothetical protein
MKQQEAGHHGSLNDGCTVSTLWRCGMGRFVIDQGPQGACLVVCRFPLVRLVVMTRQRLHCAETIRRGSV